MSDYALKFKVVGKEIDLLTETRVRVQTGAVLFMSNAMIELQPFG